MTKFFYTLGLIFIVSTTVFAQNDRQKTKAADEIRKVLDAQVAAWNKGDIDGFMQGYWNSRDLTFVSGDNVTKGWQETNDRYKRNYDTREKMGTLLFSELEIQVLSKDYAKVLGRWRVARDARDAKDSQGRFTLVFRKFKEGWRVIHDHTS